MQGIAGLHLEVKGALVIVTLRQWVSSEVLENLDTGYLLRGDFRQHCHSNPGFPSPFSYFSHNSPLPFFPSFPPLFLSPPFSFPSPFLFGTRSCYITQASQSQTCDLPASTSGALEQQVFITTLCHHHPRLLSLPSIIQTAQALRQSYSNC